MQQILIDSGPMIALFNRSDRYHYACVEFIKHNKCKLITTIASMTETMHLLNFNKNAQTDFIHWISSGAVTIENISNHDLFAIQKMLLKYSDLPMDFADACLVFLADKLNIHTIATIDRDFDVYRLKSNKPFTTLIK
ncbi:hypothetical protein SPONN_309 [uncultured Candidatus Thioglobus sp.]|nr:hypothetical protein SPONN_309 [uncultured Candidatus Thioglobus sp.]SMN00535.1 hypothetical protein SPONL_1368 [uncultured Candidatus Thioglobus sp.]